MGSSNWSSAYIYSTQNGQDYFVKLAMGGRDDSMFQGEAQGLQAMYGENFSFKRALRSTDMPSNLHNRLPCYVKQCCVILTLTPVEYLFY